MEYGWSHDLTLFSAVGAFGREEGRQFAPCRCVSEQPRDVLAGALDRVGSIIIDEDLCFSNLVFSDDGLSPGL